MHRLIIIPVLLLSFGCASFPEKPLWQAEAAWQAGHVVDVLQTINGPARDDCFTEGDPLTKSLIGENPSTEEAIAWGVAAGGIHWGVTKLLDHYNAKPWVKIAWQSVTITFKASTIVHNHNEGIRPWGRNVHECNGGSRF